MQLSASLLRFVLTLGYISILGKPPTSLAMMWTYGMFSLSWEFTADLLEICTWFFPLWRSLCSLLSTCPFLFPPLISQINIILDYLFTPTEILFSEKRQRTWNVWVRFRTEFSFLQEAIVHPSLNPWLLEKLGWQGFSHAGQNKWNLRVQFDSHLMEQMRAEVCTL